MLKRIFKSFTVAVSIVCLVVCFIPVQVFADPVSATIMANAFAQAIAAYGASSGVAMTFDVANSNGIGETMHELWKDFRNGTQDADDYETLAAALFPDLYYKALTVGTAAADIYTVGYNISSSYAEEFDNFYNWLLSGPLEMTKVDNQFYEFSSAQIGPEAVPISVVTISVGDFSNQPLPYIPDSSPVYANRGSYLNFGSGVQGSGNTWTYYVYQKDNSSAQSYFFLIPNNDSSYPYKCCVASSVQNTSFNYARIVNSNTSFVTSGAGLIIAGALDSSTQLYYNSSTNTVGRLQSIDVPVFESVRAGLDALAGEISSPSASDSLGVKAYGDGIADIPDTTDPNYEAIGRSIPSTIPWDDTIYGDGTGALTDAQSSSIASDVDLSLVEDGVIELAAESDIPAPTPGEVYIPFLPVDLPSFNFSFSGIWHYVREWVTSLGSWFAALFSMWSFLPYAMVVPVYATAVVVIVLGVYKRFFM